MKMIDDNYILMILMKLFNNNDIINNIYDFYLIDKYFDKNINNKSIQLFKKRFINNNDKIEKIVKTIKPNYFNIININKILLTEEITIKFLEQMPILIKNLNYNYKNNKNLIISICKKDPTLIKYASHELKSDKDFINKMIDIYPSSIYYAKKELKDDFDLALKAVSRDGDVIEYLSERLRNNHEIIIISLKNNFNYF
jgi:RecG-like helicase